MDAILGKHPRTEGNVSFVDVNYVLMVNNVVRMVYIAEEEAFDVEVLIIDFLHEVAY